jgi:[acyl-carrier-protein] S-malonyltransferase
MGQALAAAYPAARAVFDEVDEALGDALSALIAEGPEATLTLTENAQPALMATSMAALAALGSEGLPVTAAALSRGIRWASIRRCARPGRSAWPTRQGCCGCAARPCRLRCRSGRGRWRRCWASTSRPPAVAAEAAQGAVCAAANDNDPAQVVISGDTGGGGTGRRTGPERGAKRAVMLPVSPRFTAR